MSKLDLNRPGVWRELWPQALGLMTHLEGMVHQPLWTFGGGTVLMLRHGHRLSKDIDLFVPDPQYLGYVNPRHSDVAEAVSADYEENAEFIKLYLPQGEIDIVVGTALTAQPYEVVKHAGREIKVECSAEIIAKKMWFRGDQAKARDLFDLCAVAVLEPAAITEARPFCVRHGAAFLRRLQDRAELARAEFEAIDALDFRQSFDECLQQAREILGAVLKQRG
ncbi:MAG: nucleotidyl transferase AbiEii/AbiGii toxin family protein [Hylemonella sp.]